MPIAAVPNYLSKTGEQFYLEVPPGHRFTLYFPVWGLDAKPGAMPTWKLEEVAQQRKKEKKGQSDTWEGKTVDNKHWACTVAAGKKPDEGPDLRRHLAPKNDDGLKKWKDLFDSLSKRQNKLAEQAASIYTIPATATAPFTTGLGNEHPLENGFAFLWPYGLPYLPGSGVKGVVRRAAQELASGQWDADRGWRGFDQPAYRLEVKQGKERRRIELSVIDVLFGREPPSGDSDAVRGALSFWDVIPQIEGDSLLVEVMTPHQSHYYQIDKKKNPQPPHFQSPHDSGQPTPIFFLTVPPGSGFTFHVVCDTAHLARLTQNKLEGAPDLLAKEDGKPRWQWLVEAAFEHAFEWLGFGAKTAVGYGAMTRPPETQEAKARTESTRTVQTAQELWEKATLEYKPNTGELVASFQGHRTAPLRGEQAQACLRQLGEELSARLKKKKSLTVTAEVRRQGNLIELVGVKPCA